MERRAAIVIRAAKRAATTIYHWKNVIEIARVSRKMEGNANNEWTIKMKKCDGDSVYLWEAVA
ncbi:hypothetical protein TUM12147_16910 [Citrobacter europaeus]|nr:hypothetical protein TUM12147_16910 [Citrobacter europaeus]GIZ24468.1 hypothetical protein TUM12148_31320 [Citrobacter europaeus]